jgi:hypothetical protein
VTGRYAKPGKRTIQLRGKVAGRSIRRDIDVELKADESKHDVLATLWARRRVEELTSQDFQGIQYGRPNEAVKEQITQLGLEFRLMTQFTSFVAVEQKVVNENGQVRRVDVPVEMPDGVSYSGVYGQDRPELAMAKRASMPMVQTLAPAPSGWAPLAMGAAEFEASTVRDRKEMATPASAKIHASLRTLPRGVLSTVQLWMNQVNSQVLAQLKAAGFSVEKTEGNLLTGKVDAAHLEKLAAVAAVRSINPVPKPL